MTATIVTIALVIFTYVTVKRGHAKAVAQSEAAIRKIDMSPETRKLMREAGYCVY